MILVSKLRQTTTPFRKGLAFDTVQAAASWLAHKWEQLEERYTRAGALTMAVSMLATSPLPGNIPIIVAIAEGIRGINRLATGKRLVAKDKGTCKPGERSDLTGCTPASGSGGKVSSRESGGYEFVSPNVKEDMKFSEALSALNSPEQKKFLSTFHDVLAQVGVAKHKGRSAVGDWADGAENSVMEEIDDDVDFDTLRYTASIMGKMAKQKAVLTFKHDDNGNDAVYEMDIPAPIEEARATLAEKGVAFRTLVPTKGGSKVVIFDQGSELLSKVISVGEHYDVGITETKGTGEFIGAADREGAAGEYDKVISRWEKSGRPKYVPKELHHNGRDHAGKAGRRGLVSRLKSFVRKDKGTCEQGERADLTGCTPASGNGGKKPTGHDDEGTDEHAGQMAPTTAALIKPNPKTGVPDRARVGVPAMEVPPPPKAIPRLPNLDKRQRKVESRFADSYLENPDGFADAYLKALKKGKVGVAPNVFATDDVKALNRDWNPPGVKGGPPEELSDEAKEGMAKYNTAVHQTANAVAKRAFVKYLDDVVKGLPEGKRSVLVTNGGCAAGKGSSLARSTNPDDPHYGMLPAMEQVGAVWDAAGEQNATENAWVYEECAKRGIACKVAYVWADPEDTWDAKDRGVIRRAMRKGRMVDARLFADSYALGAKNMKAFVDRYQGKPGLDFIFLDNRKKGDPKLLDHFPEETLDWDAEKIYDHAVKTINRRKDDLGETLVGAGLAGGKIWGKPYAENE